MSEPAIASIDELAWRCTLAAGAEPLDAPAMLQAAELLLAWGRPQPARLLFLVARLRQGFSPQAVAARAMLADRLGLHEVAPAGDAAMMVSTAEGTIGEMASFAARVSADLAHAVTLRHASSFRSTAFEQLDLVDAVTALDAWLRQTLPADRKGGDQLLGQARAIARRAGRVDARAFRTASAELLAAAIAAEGMAEFVLANDDLLFEPVGSATVIHAAARLNGAGLGPYFTGVRLIAARSRDVFELADVASEAATRAGHPIDRLWWVHLLSLHLTGSLQDELIDDLGDLGALDNLAALLDRATRRPIGRVNLSLVTRLRDAALDNGDLALAARAQLLVVSVRPDDYLERLILGSIEGSCGRIAAAEQSFLACLSMRPGDRDLVNRLEALRTGGFAPYAIDRGFGSPADRLAKRLARRSQVVDPMGKLKRRPAPVDL